MTMHFKKEKAVVLDATDDVLGPMLFNRTVGDSGFWIRKSQRKRNAVAVCLPRVRCRLKAERFDNGVLFQSEVTLENLLNGIRESVRLGTTCRASCERERIGCAARGRVENVWMVFCGEFASYWARRCIERDDDERRNVYLKRCLELNCTPCGINYWVDEWMWTWMLDVGCGKLYGKTFVLIANVILLLTYLFWPFGERWWWFANYLILMKRLNTTRLIAILVGLFIPNEKRTALAIRNIKIFHNQIKGN